MQKLTISESLAFKKTVNLNLANNGHKTREMDLNHVQQEELSPNEPGTFW